MIIEKYKGVNVLRDDLLIGGSKSVLMPHIVKEDQEYVYASPVYGGFQIALSAYSQSVGKKATIFCAKRKTKHPNTLKCIEYGAKVQEIPYGYLTVVEKRARDYCLLTGAKKIVFGAKDQRYKDILADRMSKVIEEIGEPKEIWCAIGSGTLVESILQATTKSIINGVQVGAEYKSKHDRLIVHRYHKSFDKISKEIAPFQSTQNYDLKAWEYCLKYKKSTDVFFWNVL